MNEWMELDACAFLSLWQQPSTWGRERLATISDEPDGATLQFHPASMSSQVTAPAQLVRVHPR